MEIVPFPSPTKVRRSTPCCRRFEQARTRVTRIKRRVEHLRTAGNKHVKHMEFPEWILLLEKQVDVSLSRLSENRSGFLGFELCNTICLGSSRVVICSETSRRLSAASHSPFNSLFDSTTPDAPCTSTTFALGSTVVALFP